MNCPHDIPCSVGISLPQSDADVDVIDFGFVGGVSVPRLCSDLCELLRSCCLFANDEEPPGLFKALLEAVVLGVEATVELLEEWNGMFDRLAKLSLPLYREEPDDRSDPDLRFEAVV